jgi:hypothetical protein
MEWLIYIYIYTLCVYVCMYICMFVLYMYIYIYLFIYLCVCMYVYIHLCGFRKMIKVVIQRKISHNYLAIMMFVIPKYSQHFNGLYTFQDALFFL